MRQIRTLLYQRYAEAVDGPRLLGKSSDDPLPVNLDGVCGAQLRFEFAVRLHYIGTRKPLDTRTTYRHGHGARVAAAYPQFSRTSYSNRRAIRIPCLGV